MTTGRAILMESAIALCVLGVGCSYDAADSALSTGAPQALTTSSAESGLDLGPTSPTASPDGGLNLGAPCDVGSGLGACANGGTVGSDGTCQPVDPGVGDATDWHIVPAPNGSWDWDCDGMVTMNFVPAPVPPECSTYADADGCNGAPTVHYVTEASPCGERATLFTRDCDWKTLGPTCLDTPAGHRVVFQQCR